MAGEGRSLAFRDVEKTFGSVAALRPVSLQIEAGEFVTLLGPSGSGKTTLLNLAAGFLDPDGGSIRIGEQDVTWLAPRKRDIGMVFQSYALFPHMSVFDNVAYGLKLRGQPTHEIRRRTAHALAMVQLDGLGPRSVKQLSGGQQQRVALARALVIEPSVLLMDEPLGALDRQLRKHVQLELRRLHRQFGRTTLFVTHDQEEALVLSDRIAVMREGRIEQVGRPHALYQEPANVFVASFLGESNIFEGQVSEVSAGLARMDCPALGREVRAPAAPGVVAGARGGVLIRPESVAVSGADRGPAARVREVVHLGDVMAIRFELASGSSIWMRCFFGSAIPLEGREVRLEWQVDAVRVLPC